MHFESHFTLKYCGYGKLYRFFPQKIGKITARSNAFLDWKLCTFPGWTKQQSKSSKKTKVYNAFYSGFVLVSFEQMYTIKPGSYFLRMRIRSEFDMNLTSQPSFRSDIRNWVEHDSTQCEFRCELFCNICIIFAFAGSMNRALLPIVYSAFQLTYTRRSKDYTSPNCFQGQEGCLFTQRFNDCMMWGELCVYV